MIEDELSHEIYAGIIGKDVSKIISNSSSSQSMSLPPLPHYHRKNFSLSNSKYSVLIPLSSNETSSSSSSSSLPPSHNKMKCSFLDLYHGSLASQKEISQLSLDRTNKGFQMLTNMGFKESEGGLGRSRQGKLAPVKTTLKLDKRGVGSGKRLTAKVTHFISKTGKSKAAASSARTGDDGKDHGRETKAQRRQRQKKELVKEQLREKKARMLINSDLCPAYNGYLGLD